MSAVDNDISILVGLGSSFKVLEEEIFQWFAKYIVRKGTELEDDEALPRVEPMVKIGIAILKDPINQRYMTTPTTLVSS